MITDVCQYLKNWFNRKPDGTDFPKFDGTFTVSGGVVVELDGKLADGQYYRIIGSVFNDGVHKYGDTHDVLTNEVFEGAIWSMGVPKDFISLVAEIDAWQAKYGSLESEAMSPFSSESFGGYSYTKSSGTSNADGSTGMTTWQNTFSARLAPWRKI